ncbi:MAG: glycosyltransferase family 39 protein [Rhodocyclaceae bacterium]|nr:glycosyltransferase family 39 protein [Rhodocyclaceae bacterium]
MTERYTATLLRPGRRRLTLFPTTQDRRSGMALLAVLMIALVLLRLIVRGSLGIDLHYDEAQYAVWSFLPDWGYYSKPPLIAWVIGASRAFCGDTTFCVRLPSAIAFGLTPLLIFAIGRELWPYRPSVAWVAAGLFALSPLTNFYALFMTTDSLLLLCWSVALLALVRALRDGGSWWALLGVALGLGLLAKYTMGIFAVSAMMALALMPQLRPVLLTPGPWMAMFIACVMFAPNIWWNASHGFPTWHHTAEISQAERAGAGIGGLFEFIAAQLVVFGPLALAAAAYGVRRGLAPERLPVDIGPGPILRLPPMRLLACFALPFFVIICLQAGMSRAFANWAAPTYVAGSLLAAAALLGTRLHWLVGLALVLPGLTSAVAYGHESLARAIGWQIERPLDGLRGWAALGSRVEELALRDKATLVVDDRKLASELGFYAGETGRRLRAWNPGGRLHDHFQMTRNLRDLQTREGAFLIVSRRDISAGLSAAFASIEPLEASLQMPAEGEPQALRVWRGRDFLGYP